MGTQHSAQPKTGQRAASKPVNNTTILKKFFEKLEKDNHSLPKWPCQRPILRKRLPRSSRMQILIQEKKRLVESFKRLWMKLPKTILVKRTKKRKKVRRRIMLQRKMAKQSLSLRPNQSQSPKRKQLQQKRKRKTTPRMRKKPQNQKKRKIQMRIRPHPLPRKRPLLKKPPLKRNPHLKRSPNLKNASAHLSLQKVKCQKATLAKRKSKVVTLNHPKGSTKPRKLGVEGFVGLQPKNEKGVVQIPRGMTTVVLLQTKKISKNNPHPLPRKKEAKKADPLQNPSMWTRILMKILTNPLKDWTSTLIKPEI